MVNLIIRNLSIFVKKIFFYKRNFQKIAQSYWKSQIEFKEFYQKEHNVKYINQQIFVEKHLIPLLSYSDIVADIGCADGWISEKIAPLVKKVYAADLSQKMIDTAKKNSLNHNIEYKVLDICKDSNFNGESFDHVIIFGLFTCIEGYKIPLKILQNINSVINGNGYLFLKDTIKTNKGDDEKLQNENYAAFYREKNNYIKMIMNCNFELIKEVSLEPDRKDGFASYCFVFRKA